MESTDKCVKNFNDFTTPRNNKKVLVLCMVSNDNLNRYNCFINDFKLKKNEIFYFQNNFNRQFHTIANNHALAFSDNITHLLPTNFC